MMFPKNYFFLNYSTLEETGLIRGHVESTDEFMEALSVLGRIQILAIINSYFLSFLKLKVTTHSNNRNSKSSREVILGSVRL